MCIIQLMRQRYERFGVCSNSGDRRQLLESVARVDAGQESDCGGIESIGLHGMD